MASSVLARLPSTDVRSRAKAAAVHLASTALVACLSYLLVFNVWYPDPFHLLAGGRELFLLIVSVDVVLGPLLMFAVFDRSKGWRLLAMDISFIVAAQLGALTYGLHTCYLARPVALVFEVDRFRVITAIEVRTQELPQAQPHLRQLPRFSIWTLGTRPSRPDETLHAIEAALEGFDVAQRPSYWQDYELSRPAALKRSRPLDKLPLRDDEARRELTAAINRLGISMERARYLPLTSRFQAWVAVLDSDGNFLGHAAVNGF